MGMHLVKLKCRPGTQFHLGESTPFEDSVLHKSSEIIHSDTLFSALVCIAAKIGIQKPEDVLGNAKVSSCFYIMEKKEKHIFFLPRPTVPLFEELPFKLIKKIRYVSLGILKASVPIKDWFYLKKDYVPNPDLVVGNNWIATKDEFEKMDLPVEKANNLVLYQLLTAPQVRVHTDENENNLFQVERLQIHDNCLIDAHLKVHFYFLLSGDISADLNTVIHLLKDEGLGGQRSTGYGLFSGIQIIQGDIFDFEPGPDDVIMNLSLLSPSDSDRLLLEECFYKTVLRGGRNLSKDAFLKQILMFEEGAIISGKMEGNTVDISINVNMPALRYGRSFPLSISKIYR